MLTKEHEFPKIFSHLSPGFVFMYAGLKKGGRVSAFLDCQSSQRSSSGSTEQHLETQEIAAGKL